MDDASLIRLNAILLDAMNAHSILRADTCAEWFVGCEAIEERVAEVNALFADAVAHGYVQQWTEPGTSGVLWNWNSAALRRGKELGIYLASPLGEYFLNPCNGNHIDASMFQEIEIETLEDDVYEALNPVFEKHVCYVVLYRGKPTATILPLIALQLLGIIFKFAQGNESNG